MTLSTPPGQNLVIGQALRPANTKPVPAQTSPAGHEWHSVSAMSPYPSEYFPATQLVVSAAILASDVPVMQNFPYLHLSPKSLVSDKGLADMAPAMQ